MTDQAGWFAPGPEAGGPPPATPGYGAQPPPYAATSGGYGQPPPGQAPLGWGPPPPGPPPPPRPGVIPLRPLGIGEILDGSISTMRAHPRPMLGLSLLVAVVVQLITLPLSWLFLRDNTISFSFDPQDQPTPEDQFALLANTSIVSVLQVMVTLIAVLFLTGVLTAVVSRAVLGETTTIGEAWQLARPRLLPLAGATVLVLLLEIGLAAVAFGPAILLGVLDAPAALVVLMVILGLVGFSVLGVYLYVIFALAPTSVVLERQGVVAALRRSRTLVKGAWWRTAWLLFLIFVIAYVISLVLALPFTVAGMITAYLAGDGEELKMFAALPLMVTGIGSILTSAITWPFTATGSVLVYVDRRIRREGLDIELARAAGFTPTGQHGSSPQFPSSEQFPGPSYGTYQQ